MKKSTITLFVIGAIVILLAGWVTIQYNGMVANDEAVTTAWAGVESQYQRRSDLIPNLVNTVKGYAAHEKETLEGVVEARAKATQVTVSADNLTPERFAEFQKAQGELSAALGRLMRITENYPQLRANENFSELQAQLEGTENRINESRLRFNEAVQEYNLSIRRFPGNIFAGLFGFEKRDKFEATDGAEQAPKVEF
ncbi:MAG TPA: LemA family protein [Candidatus Caccomonas pullistercoris]|nr:LemA family protein [Candidatus Caccomonas pullistercoris]